MQDAIIADNSNSVKLTLWEEFCGSLEKDKTYLMKNVKVRRYNGEKYLNTPKNEGCNIQEVEPLEGPLPEINIPQLLTSMEVIGEICDVNSINSAIACSGCSFSIQPKEDQVMVEC